MFRVIHQTQTDVNILHHQDQNLILGQGDSVEYLKKQVVELSSRNADLENRNMQLQSEKLLVIYTNY